MRWWEPIGQDAVIRWDKLWKERNDVYMGLSKHLPRVGNTRGRRLQNDYDDLWLKPTGSIHKGPEHNGTNGDARPETRSLSTFHRWPHLTY